MASADVRLVDLECVLTAKDEPEQIENHINFRANPDQINILKQAGVNIVLTANDHSGDYGKEALLEQQKYLDAAEILYAGSGKNFDEAFAPVYKKVGDITLAIFSVDTKMPAFAATLNSPGTAYLPANNLELWKETFSGRIQDAQKKADVVIVAPHWGENFARKPSKEIKTLAHLLIDLGADAVLGCNSHLVHGVENYKNRPIIYDAGDLLFDSGRRNGGCFHLDISTRGVEKVKFIPLVVRNGQTLRARDSAPAIRENFIAACNEFDTFTTDLENNIVEISLASPTESIESEYFVAKVPDEAIIKPQRFGALKLIGFYIPPDCQTMTRRKFLAVETYWTIQELLDKNYNLSIIATPVRECKMHPWKQNKEQNFLAASKSFDQTGIIYCKKFLLVPPTTNNIVNVDLQVELQIKIDEKPVGKFNFPDLIKMRFPDRTYFNTDFDEIIYHSEPGKCWTAEQLAKVTGGEWIVPPPEGWYVNSFSEFTKSINALMPRPTLLMAAVVGSQDSHKKILGNINRLDGAIISHNVEGLPPSFPLLKVENSGRAMYEIGFAARKRFKGKTIAVTGSAGKTTTCNMLRHTLGKDHEVTATPGTVNAYIGIPWVFSHVKPNDAYAIVEISEVSLNGLNGSITYEITPDVAVVTSIAPAHIGKMGSLEEIAQRKSNILCGMMAGSYAVLNRDMPHYEIFAAKAKSLKLNILTFGTHPDSFVRMPVFKDGGNFSVMGKTYKLSCPVPVDQLYDALAVIAVSVAVGFSIEKALEYLQTFSPVAGRGNILKSTRNKKSLTIINSSYNANPFSMKNALEHLKAVEPNQKSRVAILGDIAELGENSAEYHKGLAEAMLDAAPDRLLLCGGMMHYPYELVKDKLNCTWFETLDKLLAGVETHLQDGDTILIKSSHATGLSKVVALLSKDTPPN